jgi:NADPH:quinone reductase
MRAVVCHSFTDPSATMVEQVGPPLLQPGTVRVSIKVAGVSFANRLTLTGQHQNRSDLPFTPGTEIAGVVTECATGVTRIKVGDRVAAGVQSGGFAEQAVVPQATVYRLPDAVDFEQAVHFPTLYATAYAGLAWRAHLEPGETVLVFGAAGGSGQAAIGVARNLGARVIAVAGDDAKLAAARHQGAALCIDRRLGPVPQAVLDATGGRGADVVYDPVGGDAFRDALRCIAPDGRLVTMGFASGQIPTVAANIALVKNISVIGLYWGYYAGWGRLAPPPGTEDKVQAAMAVMLDWCARCRLTPRTCKTWPLEQFRQALDAIGDREVIGRVSLVL